MELKLSGRGKTKQQRVTLSRSVPGIAGDDHVAGAGARVTRMSLPSRAGLSRALGSPNPGTGPAPDASGISAPRAGARDGVGGADAFPALAIPGLDRLDLCGRRHAVHRQLHDVALAVAVV